MQATTGGDVGGTLHPVTWTDTTGAALRVVRIYHAGRDAAHRARERALVAAGVELRLVVPAEWPGPDAGLADEDFDVVELGVERAGDVNRHRYRDPQALGAAITRWLPDVVDVHEEPVSVVGRQVLSLVGDLPVVMYTAQNLDKRFPPPFAGWERAALQRVQGVYPCSRQAASVLRGKGYTGLLRPMPLGIDERLFFPGQQHLAADEELTMALVGRLVPEKGLTTAVRVLAAVRGTRPARLVVAGSGPDEAAARSLAKTLRVDEAVDWHPWLDAQALAGIYRRTHVVLVPSSSTATWVEQFGRVITEGSACGAVPFGYASGSIPEVVDATGVVVEEGRPDLLIRAALDLIGEPERWAALRTSGIARATELRWSAVAAAMVDLYRDAQRLPPPGRLVVDRAAAAAEWGLPARTSVSARPFALPVLRQSRTAHRLADRLSR